MRKRSLLVWLAGGVAYAAYLRFSAYWVEASKYPAEFRSAVLVAPLLSFAVAGALYAVWPRRLAEHAAGQYLRLSISLAVALTLSTVPESYLRSDPLLALFAGGGGAVAGLGLGVLSRILQRATPSATPTD